MTTIAYRERWMAGDSIITEGDYYVTRDRKIVRLTHGHLLGMSGDGDQRDLVTLLRFVRDEGDLPSRAALTELKLGFNVLLVLRKGHVWNLCAGQEDDKAAYWAQVGRVRERIFSVGNGSKHALGAMAAGANAKAAVRIACRFDRCSGPPVYAVHL